MPAPPSGPELDRLVNVALCGEAKRHPAPYSADAYFSRLVRRLEGLGLSAEVEVEESDGLAYCVLRRGGQRVATGSGETRAIALARAVVNCRFPAAARNAASSEPPRDQMRVTAFPSVGENVSVCADCGAEVRRLKRPPRAPVVCNPCGWKRVKNQPLRSPQPPRP